jgi:HAD superfamily hydrolase (TIGR01509 family)
MGLRKPDAACYSRVIEDLGLATTPERVVFFDDSVDCIRGALIVGMQAHRVNTVPDLRHQLELLGIL